MSPRTLLALAALTGAVAFAGAAAAQTPENTATIQTTFRGQVDPACLLSIPSSPTSENAQLGAAGPGSADISIGQLAGDDGASLGATIVLVLPAVCNQAHTLNLASLNGGLLGDGPAPTGGPFRSNLPYSVTVAWAGGEQSFLTEDDALSFAVGDAAVGSVTVTIQIPPGGAPLAAGAYSDELILELGAAG